MQTYHIYLYRHGETEANEKGYYAGTTEVSLSKAGKKQLKDLKEKYYYPNTDIIYTSPRLRCLQTLEIIYPERDATMVDDLSECDFGDYEGKTLNELADDEDYQKWSSGALDCPPNGESSKEFQLRTCRAFEKIVTDLMTSRVNTSAAIMAHGGTIMTILGTYGFPRRPMYEWTCESGMGYEILITPNLWMSGKAFEVSGYVPLEPGEREGDLSDEFAYFNEAVEYKDDEDYDDGDLVDKAEQEEIDREEDN